MESWIKKNYLYCFLIALNLIVVFLIIFWLCYEDLRQFLVFLASILIATSAYMLLLIQNIIQKKEKEKIKIKKKIKKLKIIYRMIRDIIFEIHDEYSKHAGITDRNNYLGSSTRGLIKFPKYVKLLKCEIISDSKRFSITLKYNEDYVIEPFDNIITLRDKQITLNQEEINTLLKDLKNTYKEAKAKL